MLFFSLSNKSDEPIYHQIYSYIKTEILAGRLRRGEKLPSARSLANTLSVSRNPVDTAYEQLVAEGYLYASARRGYYVSSITYTQKVVMETDAQEKESEYSRETWLYDFNPDAVDVENFPYSVWKSIGRSVLNQHELFQAGDYRGDEALRRAVAGYLHGSRGVLCHSGQIIIGAGMSYLLQLLAVLFQEDKRIVFEEPGYVRARQILASNGFKICALPVEEGGMDVEAMRETGISLCYLTPSHQFPLGGVMPVAQRQEFLKWAGSSERNYIIEDDHDSEYRYKGKPIPAMQSLDVEGKVIYIGTFSKAIGPALRMAYMVLPERLISEFKERCGAYNCPVSRFDQAMMAQFIQQGYFEKHLNRMRKKYKEKHDAVLNVFRRYPDKVSITGDYAGLYVIARAEAGKSEEQILHTAKKYGVNLRPISMYYDRLPAGYRPSFLIGFALPSLQQIEEGIELLCRRIL